MNLIIYLVLIFFEMSKSNKRWQCQCSQIIIICTMPEKDNLTFHFTTFNITT